MTKPKVYVDGQAGTTGLEIVGRLQDRKDIELLLIEDELRHDDRRRAQLMNQADLVFLCLPDEASRQAVKLITSEKTKVIDTSTAFRTQWTYGFAQLSPAHAAGIAQSRFVANPGCHASGVIALLYPLMASGLLKPDAVLSFTSLTGYSGGGKKMIAEYERDERDKYYDSPRLYAMGLNHKHIPEIETICHLERKPLFVPVVADYKRGMVVSLMLDRQQLNNPAADMADLYRSWYGNSALFEIFTEHEGMLAANEMAGKDGMRIYIQGNADQILLSTVFDNLGKGASGAAIENMNRMLGLKETEGLKL